MIDEEQSTIHNLITEIAVYPLLVVNLAIGFLMFANSHQFLLVFSSWLYQDGGLDGVELGPSSFVQLSVSGFGAVILGVLALIAFGVLESFYSHSTERPLILFWRFLRVSGIQLFYLGGVQLAMRLMVGIELNFNLIMIIAQLMVGTGLVFFSAGRWKKLPDDLSVAD